MMTQREKGRIGGIATRDGHITVCPVCGRPMQSKYFTKVGSKGGIASSQNAGRNGTLSMSERGKLGGRGNTRERRLLSTGGKE